MRASDRRGRIFVGWRLRLTRPTKQLHWCWFSPSPCGRGAGRGHQAAEVVFLSGGGFALPDLQNNCTGAGFLPLPVGEGRGEGIKPQRSYFCRVAASPYPTYKTLNHRPGKRKRHPAFLHPNPSSTPGSRPGTSVLPSLPESAPSDAQGRSPLSHPAGAGTATTEAG